MLIDDRLSTVLHSGITGDAAARAQFRQLLDLVGALYPGLAHAPYEAHKRLDELQTILPVSAQTSILCEPGMRLRNTRLIDQLAHGHAQVADAAIKAASLTAAQWMALIPELPSDARDLLRLRTDLAPEVTAMLKRFSTSHVCTEPNNGELSPPCPAEQRPHALESVLELAARPPAHRPEYAALSQSTGSGDSADSAARPAPAAFKPRSTAPSLAPQAEPGTLSAQSGLSQSAVTSIADLLERMEHMRQSRGAIEAALAPAPVFASEADRASDPARSTAAAIVPDNLSFTTDSSGAIITAPNDVAVLFVGMVLAQNRFGAVAWLDEAGAKAMRQHTPLHGALLTIDAAPVISGLWAVYAAPLFDTAHGAFIGFTGYLQRLSSQAATPTPADTRQSDAMRQLLHELRTPVNAIQGFAEVIQQQVFGPVPNDYRALAAAITMDAARLMAGFDEIERFAKLQSNAIELEQGSSDLSGVLHATVQRITGALRPHAASIALIQTGRNFTVAVATEELEQLIWRIAATLAGNLQAGEVISLALHNDGPVLRLIAELPIALRDQDNVFQAAPHDKPVLRSISAGMFGTGYSLRLARAEAKAAGGTLVHKQDHLELTFTALPNGDRAHNPSHQALEPAAG